jgi:nitrogen fixation NifU-like protein
VKRGGLAAAFAISTSSTKVTVMAIESLPLQLATGLAILFCMFSEAVLDHFRNPRNAGELAKADATVEVSNPVCGDVLQLAVRIDQGRIAEARFRCRGCTTSIACASLLTEQLQGKAPSDICGITAQSLSLQLGGLPQATYHGADLAADAAKAVHQKLSATR